MSSSSNDGRGRAALSLVGSDPDILFYARLAAEAAAPVLLLGSANGRVAWALGERGIPVLGVDPSRRMVQAAEERRAGASPEAGERVRFLEADLRALRLGERYALVLAPQHALGLMGGREGLEAALATVQRHLAPGGRFAFDVLNPTEAAAGGAAGREAPPTSALEARRLAFAFHLRERHASGRPGGIRRLRLHPFGAGELEAALAAAGLVLHERYGRFDGKPFEPGDPLHIGVAAAP